MKPCYVYHTRELEVPMQILNPTFWQHALHYMHHDVRFHYLDNMTIDKPTMTDHVIHPNPLVHIL